MRRPPNRPICKHGQDVGKGQCKDCWYENLAIRLLVRPVLDQYWTNRGDTDIADSIYKAFKLGRKTTDDEITLMAKRLMADDRVKKEWQSNTGAHRT